MKNLIAVYQKFKHLDKLLSDGHMMSYKAENKISACCHELWMAIKAAQVLDMPTDKPFIDLGEGVKCNSCLKRFCACYDRVSGRMSGQYPPVINPVEATTNNEGLITKHGPPEADLTAGNSQSQTGSKKSEVK